MATQYDDLQGTETPVHEHPDSTSTGVQTRLAGDVIPFPISMHNSDWRRANDQTLRNKIGNENVNRLGQEVKPIPIRPDVK